jgi:hypothetical protein
VEVDERIYCRHCGGVLKLTIQELEEDADDFLVVLACTCVGYKEYGR